MSAEGGGVRATVHIPKQTIEYEWSHVDSTWVPVIPISTDKPSALTMVFLGVILGLLFIMATGLIVRSQDVDVPAGCQYIEDSGYGWIKTDYGMTWAWVNGPHAYCPLEVNDGSR